MRSIFKFLSLVAIIVAGIFLYRMFFLEQPKAEQSQLTPLAYTPIRQVADTKAPIRKDYYWLKHRDLFSTDRFSLITHEIVTVGSADDPEATNAPTPTSDPKATGIPTPTLAPGVLYTNGNMDITSASGESLTLPLSNHVTSLNKVVEESTIHTLALKTTEGTVFYVTALSSEDALNSAYTRAKSVQRDCVRLDLIETERFNFIPYCLKYYDANGYLESQEVIAVAVVNKVNTTRSFLFYRKQITVRDSKFLDLVQEVVSNVE